MTPTVSVCMVTYQHAAFIKDAIEGALAQQADFPVEILIGEDGSTDGTREICLDYARRQPDRIRVSLRDRTEVLSGGKPAYIARNFLMTLREARGEFIALCEGDDYWTDPTKLQRQVDYLRANPDCAGCFHDAKLVDARGQTLRESYFQSDQDKFTQQDVLETLLSREPTCSLVFRRSAIKEPLPEWYLRLPCDLHLDILLAGHGSLGFIRRNMGAYRKHAGGIWSGQRETHQIIELIVRYKLLLADAYFLGKYQELLLRKIDEFQATLFTRQEAAGEVHRLEGIVQEQTNAVKSIQIECGRLTAETKAAGKAARQAAKDAQKHIDALKAQLDATVADHQKIIDGLRKQLDQLAATSREQAAHISVIENERYRLTTLAEAHAKDIAHYVKVMAEQAAYIKTLEALQRQVEQLAATSREQAAHISGLEQERNRLTDLVRAHTKDNTHYVKVMGEQAAYIGQLEQQRKQAAGKKSGA